METMTEKQTSKIVGESNESYAMRLARAIPKDELIHDLLAHIERLTSKGRNRGLPLWSHVGEATSHGSGVSASIVAIYYPESKTR